MDAPGIVGAAESPGAPPRLDVRERNGAVTLIVASVLAALVSSAYAEAPPEGEAADTFEELLALAEHYDDDRGADPAVENRDVAVEYYRRALAARPNHPDNLWIEYQIGMLLLQIDPANKLLPRRDEAREVFQNILQKGYDQQNYYRTEPAPGPYDAQLLLPAAAVHAGSMAASVGQSRAYYWQAMEYLNQTYLWRKADYEAMEQPAYEDFTMPCTRPQEAQRRYESALAKYNERKAALANNAIFASGKSEQFFSVSAVRQYANTFKGKAERIEVMRRVAKTFPGTPMAEFASRVIQGAESGTMTMDELFEKFVNSSAPSPVHAALPPLPAAQAPPSKRDDGQARTAAPAVSQSAPIPLGPEERGISEPGGPRWWMIIALVGTTIGATAIALAYVRRRSKQSSSSAGK